MEMCVQFVTQLKEHIQDHMISVLQPYSAILNYYLSEMESQVCAMGLRAIPVVEMNDTVMFSTIKAELPVVKCKNLLSSSTFKFPINCLR